jgi:putative ABC transport system permease protein
VILSEAIWRTHFHADPGLVGRTIQLNEQNYQVVGIIPASFRLPLSAGIQATAITERVRIFTPLVLAQGEFRNMSNFNYNAVARLKPGATAEQALAEVNVVQARFPQQAGVNTELKAVLIPVHELVAGRARTGLWMLAGSVGAVLLIVCINLANLLLSRIASRRQEAAIRTALGASRGRQFRLVLTESLLLSLTGGILGVVLAGWLMRLLVASTTVDLPRLDEIRLDSNVLGFSFCLTVITGVLCGALPAWRLALANPRESLHSGNRTVTEGQGGMRLRQSLIGLEVGLCAALLIVAGLLTSSLTRLLEVDKGFDTQQVLTADIRLAGNLYSEDVNRRLLFDRILAKVNSLPGVLSAGIVTALPTRGETWLDPIYLEGATRSEDRHAVNNRFVSPGYFGALNISIRMGRAIEETDRDQRVAVLSQKAAKRLWPDVPNPIGRRFMAEDNKPTVLIGIAADVRATLQEEAPPTVYYPYWQRVPGSAYLVVRTSANAHATAALRRAIREEDAQIPLPPIRTMDEIVDLSVAQRRFQLTLILVFAGSALLVAILGIYGVVSYSVARRRNEIGIRMALGAQRSELLAMVVRQGMMPVVVGLAGGLTAAFFLGQAIRSLLFGIQPADPPTMGAVAFVLLVVGVLACLVPAARAARTDAIAALRVE